MDYKSWYAATTPRYQQLAQRVRPIIETALASESIFYSHIQSRIKSFKSFNEKVIRNKYTTLDSVIDLLGFRIICYFHSDIERISNVIQENFQVYNLEDKSRKLGINKIGYRSVHFVVSLSKSRTKLPEYFDFKGLEFEIQLRTILEHAWAEIEHDRKYKFRGKLPYGIKKDLNRDFNRLSGSLEGCDKDFDRISNAVDLYSDNVISRIKKGELSIPINSASLRQYLTQKFGDIPAYKAQFVFAESSEIIEELKAMNIITLQDLENIIPPNFKNKLKRIPKPNRGVTLDRLIRFVLIIHNQEDYFGRAWSGHFYEYYTYDYRVFEEFGVNMKTFPDQVESDCSLR